MGSGNIESGCESEMNQAAVRDGGKSSNATHQSQTNRVSDITQQWFLTEPLLFGAWMTHRFVPNPQIRTMRSGRGLIEFNDDYLRTLDSKTLREVMKFEVLRIILKHPYERRKPKTEMAWEASNFAIRECTSTSLKMPSAKSKFGKAHSGKYFEYYYDLLCGVAAEKGDADSSWNDGLSGECDAESDDGCEGDEGNCAATGEGDGEGGGSSLSQKKNGNKTSFRDFPNQTDSDPTTAESDSNSETASSRAPKPDDYCDAGLVGSQNAIEWDYDQFQCEVINDLITEIESSNNWGTVAGSSRELILASRRPKLDYRRVLQSFRATILASSRQLTRMKPSRRYGFQYMGSRRDFTTHILFAVDVSGSVSTQDVQNAFSIVNRLFKYGVESIDVIWFDTKIRCEDPITLKKARQQVAIFGRGGTNFQPLMKYLDEHREYDGMIVFTDGIAAIPTPPKRNRRTRVCWLFNHEDNWKTLHRDLELPGMVSAFVYAD